MIRPAAVLTVAFLGAATAWAQGPDGSAPVEAWDPSTHQAPDPARASATALSGRGPACGGLLSHGWFPRTEIAVPVSFDADVPAAGVAVHGASPAGGVSGGLSGGGGELVGGALNEPVALLAVAVVTAAALPVVLYALDDEARPDIQRCWELPSARFLFHGTSANRELGSTAMLSTRLSTGFGFLGLEAGGDGGSGWFSGVDAHLLLRMPPHQRVELNLGLGVRTMTTPAYAATWLELSLPHRYLPFRESSWEPGVALEVRPAVLFATGALDFRLDATLDLPVSPFASLQLGGRAFSLAGEVRFAALGGFSVAP